MSVTISGTTGLSNVPAGSIAATNTQAALNELDTEKAALAGSASQAFSGAAATSAAHLVRYDQTVGIGQTPTGNLYGSTRADNTNYTNTSSKPIMVYVSQPATAGASLDWYLSGSVIMRTASEVSASTGGGGCMMVPPGLSYKVQATGVFMDLWVEVS